MNHYRATATIASGAAISDPIDLSAAVPDAGLIYLPDVWTAASLSFLISDRADGVYAPVRDGAGAIVAIAGIQTGAGAWYQLPAALRGASFIKLWSQTSGSNINQAGDRVCKLVAKG